MSTIQHSSNQRETIGKFICSNRDWRFASNVKKLCHYLNVISTMLILFSVITTLCWSVVETTRIDNIVAGGHGTFSQPFQSRPIYASLNNNHNSRRAPPTSIIYSNKNCGDCQASFNYSSSSSSSSPLRSLINDNHRRYHQEAISPIVPGSNQNHHSYSSRPNYDIEPDTILIVGHPINIPNESSVKPKKKIFKANQNQDCPKTGGTVCDQIQSYPSDEIYQVVTAVKKSLNNVGFKLDGLFSDERDNDLEPVLRRPRDINEEKKKLGTGVVVYETRIKYPLVTSANLINTQQPQTQLNIAKDNSDQAYNNNYGAYYKSDEEDYSYLSSKRGEQTKDNSEDQKETQHKLESLLTINNNNSNNNKEDTILSEMDNYKNLRTKRSEQKNIEVKVSTNSLARLTKRQATSTLDPELSNNLSNTIQISPLCLVKSIYITPRTALNDKREWKYVVNTPEKDPQVRQIIRVDICQDPLGPCSDQVSLPFGFVSQCKQKYSKKKLLAINGDNGELEVDTFFIPSCCVCQLIRDPDSLGDSSERRSK